MHDSKLIQSIKVLTKEEIEGVKELLYSDYLIKGSYKNECIRLFEYIMPYYPEFESEALDRNIVLEEIFKGEGSKINRLEKTMSALLNIVDFYITHFLLESNTGDTKNNINLSIFYKERDYFGRSKNLFKKAEGYLLEQSKIDIDYYECLYLLKYEKLNIEDLLEKKFDGDAYLDLLNDIDEIAFIKKMNHIVRVSYRKGSVDKIIMEKIQEEINRNEKLQKNPLIITFLLAILLLESSFSDNFNLHYQDFLTKVENYKNILSFEINRIMSIFEQECIRIYNNRKPSYNNLKLLHDSRKKHLRNGYISYDGRIPRMEVFNFLVRSLRLNDKEWLREFIIENEKKLGNFKENKYLVNLCWAAYYFMEKEYENIDELLLQKYDNYHFQIFARRLRMKIYYETKEEVILTYEIDAHKVYVHRLYARKEIDINHYETNTNFCNRFKQIINLRHNPDEKTKARLLEKVKSQKCSDSEWLLEKIEEIKVPYSKK